jgi:predicted RecA/RadA family phage recombinase
MAQAEYARSSDMVTYTPGAAEVVAAGDVKSFGTGVQIIQAPSTDGRPVGAAIRGEFEFDKLPGAGTSYVQGEAVGWDSANSRARKFTAGANNYLGVCTQVASTTDATIRVSINKATTPALP